MKSPQVPAGWYPDPTLRFAQRYWDGFAWTSNAADVAGAQSYDPVQAAPVAGESAPAQPDEAREVMARLEQAMADYEKLLDEADLDEATFARRALKIGLIVRDADAWILDLPSGRWFHYNGVGLSPLGGWTRGATDGPR